MLFSSKLPSSYCRRRYNAAFPHMMMPAESTIRQGRTSLALVAISWLKKPSESSCLTLY